LTDAYPVDDGNARPTRRVRQQDPTLQILLTVALVFCVADNQNIGSRSCNNCNKLHAYKRFLVLDKEAGFCSWLPSWRPNTQGSILGSAAVCSRFEPGKQRRTEGGWGGGVNPPIPKLSRIPISVENTSVKPNKNTGFTHLQIERYP
jgi:hypothetical protein